MRISTRFRPGTVFKVPTDGLGQGWQQYVAVSHPFPHPDLPIHQIWAVSTTKDGYFRDAPMPELVDLGSDTHLTVCGEILIVILQFVIGVFVLGFLALSAYFFLESLVK